MTDKEFEDVEADHALWLARNREALGALFPPPSREVRVDALMRELEEAGISTDTMNPDLPFLAVQVLNERDL